METPQENNELQYLAPTLSQLEKSNAFALPENYFQEMENALQAQIIEEKLKSEIPSPTLALPPNYFANMEAKISAQIFQKPRISFLQSILKFKNYAAAAIVLFVLSTAMLLHNNDESKNIGLTVKNTDTVIAPSKTTETTDKEKHELESYILSHYSSEEIASN